MPVFMVFTTQRQHWIQVGFWAEELRGCVVMMFNLNERSAPDIPTMNVFAFFTPFATTQPAGAIFYDCAETNVLFDLESILPFVARETLPINSMYESC